MDIAAVAWVYLACCLVIGGLIILTFRKISQPTRLSRSKSPRL